MKIRFEAEDGDNTSYLAAEFSCRGTDAESWGFAVLDLIRLASCYPEAVLGNAMAALDVDERDVVWRRFVMELVEPQRDDLRAALIQEFEERSSEDHETSD